MYGYARTMIRTMMQQNVKTIEKSKQTGNTMGLGVSCPRFAGQQSHLHRWHRWHHAIHLAASQDQGHLYKQSAQITFSLRRSRASAMRLSKSLGGSWKGLNKRCSYFPTCVGRIYETLLSGLLRAKLGRHCFCNVGTDLFFQRAIWIENWETHSAMTILSAILHGQTSVAERALNLKQICQEH